MHLYTQLGAALSGRALEIEASQAQLGNAGDTSAIMLLKNLDKATCSFIQQVMLAE